MVLKSLTVCVPTVLRTGIWKPFLAVTHNTDTTIYSFIDAHFVLLMLLIFLQVCVEKGAIHFEDFLFFSWTNDMHNPCTKMGCYKGQKPHKCENKRNKANSTKQTQAFQYLGHIEALITSIIIQLQYSEMHTNEVQNIEMYQYAHNF